MKLCSKCNQSKEASLFYNKKTTKDGLFQWCIACHKMYTKGWYLKQLEDPHWLKNELERVSQWRINNPEKAKQIEKRYIKKHLPSLIAKNRKRFCGKIQRTPKWLTANDSWMMKEAYHLAALRTKITGFKWHVDHIVPLQGKLVSGFHTPYNLQVIPAVENKRKGNSFAVT